jgi:long-chain fatty acid adenylyltransferase FadD28
MPVTEAAEFAIPPVLREHASRRPNDPAFTFVDYAADPVGVPETLTWSRLYRRSCGVAQALSRCASVGDRAVVVAPQGFDYIVAFVGALQAGLVAVPLSVPQRGDHDERISSVLADSSPSAVLTTSAVSGGMEHYLRRRDGRPAPSLIEVDALDRLSPTKFGDPDPNAEIAYLQYTSGSTRQPAGVMVSHRNLAANFEQVMRAYFADTGNVAPPDTTMVSWLPFYHDMGLWIGVSSPILAGLHSVVFNPMSFLMRPARWLQLMAANSKVFTPAPNFALELAVRRISDNDMAGLDLGDVTHIISGAERVHAGTLKRFTDRFAPFNLRPEALCPSYGLAEATVYVAAGASDTRPTVAHFDSEKLSAGVAERCTTETGPGLVGYRLPSTPIVRIVDPETRTENEAGTIGEIWAYGDNVALGYWHKPDETERTFRASLVDPSAGTPEGPWLRTGDLGVVSEGELFIMGRIKDVLIVYGRNHYPDDIEATIQEITDGRVAAISVPGDHGEKLAVIAEFMPSSISPDEVADELDQVEGGVISTVSTVHGVRVEDFVPVPPGSIPLTTSGKIKRSACAELYRSGQFIRIDADDELCVGSDGESPDEIEATISQISGGRVAAISVPHNGTEDLVAIVELTTEQTVSCAEQTPKLRAIKRDITSALSTSHGLRVADLVLVPPGSIPITTGGRVRRSACLERYRDNEFKRLDVSANILNEAW